MTNPTTLIRNIRQTVDRKGFYLFILCVSFVLLGACSSIVRKEAPTLSHIHLGHAITAWEAAPNEQGLLVAAELYSIRAKASSDLMLEAAQTGEIDELKRHLDNIANTVDPSILDPERQDEYTLRRLVAEAMVHLKIASEIYDASANVRRTVAGVNVNAQEIVNTIDELIVFIKSALETDDGDELIIFAEEISRLVDAIAGEPGTDSAYGIYNFKQDIDAMVAREDPPYQTVDKYYLFSIGI